MRTIEPFAQGHLSSVLDNCTRQLQEKVNSENQDYLLNVNESEYIDHLVSEFTINPPTVDFDNLYADHTEKAIPAERHPNTGFFIDADKSYTRQVIIYFLPFSGDVEILNFMPSPGILWSEEFTQVYKVLAHPMRLEILLVLLNKDLSVNDLSQQLKKRQSNVSQHLQVLRKSNLVSSNRSGKRRIYMLDHKNEVLVRYLSKYKI